MSFTQSSVDILTNSDGWVTKPFLNSYEHAHNLEVRSIWANHRLQLSFFITTKADIFCDEQQLRVSLFQ